MLEEESKKLEQNAVDSKKIKEHVQLEIEWVKELQSSLGEEEWLRDKVCLDDEEYLDRKSVV